jgi:hypothetical protein
VSQDIQDSCRALPEWLPGWRAGRRDAPGMSKARLVIMAVTVEKRPVGAVARSYGVARPWSARSACRIVPILKAHYG